jgi:basic membrane lipoprotein Med (substrate-binding protein (PBP1-ABC) superfamily)
MIAPFIGYSQKLPTNTLKPELFTKINGITIYGFNRSQTEYLITEKNSKDICVQKSLYKDSIIDSKDSIIKDLNTINKSTLILLDTCGNRYDKSVNLNIIQQEEIKRLNKVLIKRNMTISFLSGAALSIALFLLLF